MRIQVRFRTSIITIMLALVGSLTLTIYLGIWVAGNRASAEGSERLFDSVSSQVESEITGYFSNIVAFVAYGAEQSDTSIHEVDTLKSPVLTFLLEGLQQNPSFYSLYYGFEDGTFLQVIATRGNQEIIKARKAPAETQWIIRSIMNEDGGRILRWLFLDAELTRIGGLVEPDPAYDPRLRPWYVRGIENKQVHLSPAYMFSSWRKPGVTMIRKLASGAGVFAVDLTLDGLSSVVSETRVSENGGIYLVDSKENLVANSFGLHKVPELQNMQEVSEPVFRTSWKALRDSNANAQLSTVINDASWFARSHSVDVQGAVMNLVIVAPEDDFQVYFNALKQQVLLLSLLCVLVFVPLAYVLTARLSRHIRELTDYATQVGSLEFKSKRPRFSWVSEFNQLIRAFWRMGRDLESRNRELKTEQEKLSRLVDLGIRMSAEKNSDKLMEMILLGAKELTNADGGTLYILEDGKRLCYQIVKNSSLGLELGGTTGKSVTFSPVDLYDCEGEPNHANIVSHAIHLEQSIVVDDAYDRADYDFSGTRAFDQENSYRSKSFLTVPLKPRGGEVIGALQLVNALSEKSDEIIPFGEEMVSFIEALSAQAATALYNRALLEKQEELMDSLIRLMAGAIDAKSQYTGAHCKRVPTLARMLAEEAGKVDSGSLADFSFSSRDEWREFEIGAWLHDCGKVTTPEYVVDKATKLETIYNRIHEIRTRFEVLLRDAEIAHLKEIMEGSDPDGAVEEYERQRKMLFDDFEFVANSNVGGEFMADEDIARIRDIAERTWQRNFDIKKGLSHIEEERFSTEPDAPCEEKLLSDKEFHVVPRDAEMNYVYQDGNFKVDVPDDLYNQGELYNLSIKKGTLTDEERFKINEHVMHTIVMLEQLPLPSHLTRVPEYAGTHHETLHGSGYPRKLTGDQISVPARIMAIADIFEALTAADRPYKKPKSLSEAVKILSFFKKDKDIDPALFDLFLSSGVYRRYAEQFLKPEQIDEVDINDYLG